MLTCSDPPKHHRGSNANSAGLLIPPGKFADTLTALENVLDRLVSENNGSYGDKELPSLKSRDTRARDAVVQAEDMMTIFAPTTSHQ